MVNFRTFEEVTEEDFRNHPEKMDTFVSVLFEEYVEDRDMATLLSALRIVCRVKDVSDRIVHNPDILDGKPVIKGTRIPVDLVLQYLTNDPDIKNLFTAFPHLTIEDVEACLLYAGEQELQIFPLLSHTSLQEQAHL